MSPSAPSCPRCGVPVQPDWDWCHGCNFHPDELAVPASATAAGAAAAPAAAPAPAPAAHVAAGALLTPPRKISAPPSSPGPAQRAGRVVGGIVVLVVAAVAIGAIVVVVGRGSSNRSSSPAATPAFASGLAVWFTSSDPGSHPVLLPDGLAGCVQQKLTVGDAGAISALQVPSDQDHLTSATQINVYRALESCDLSGAAEVFTGQGAVFAEMGVHAIGQQQCVTEHFIEGVAAFDEHATGPIRPRIDAEMERAFQACVPIAEGLAAVLARVHGPTPDQAQCISQAMATTIRWTDLFHIKEPASKQKFDTALRAAITLCR